MAWSTNPYATLSQLQLACDLSDNQITADGSWIQELLVEAQEDIDSYLGFRFQTDGTTQSPATRVYDGNDMHELFIDRCVSISQVLETQWTITMGTNGQLRQTQTNQVDITADVVLGPNNYSSRLIPSGYMLRRKSGYPFVNGSQNYQVSGVFGIAVIPPNITRATCRLVAHYYKMRDTNYSDIIAEQGGVRQKYTKQMPIDVVEILDKFKRRRFLAWGN
jgi:hypothetical protein